MLELVVHHAVGDVWDRLAAMVVATTTRGRIVLKGAQVVPEAVARAIEEANVRPSVPGPGSLRPSVQALCEVLQLKLPGRLKDFLENTEVSVLPSAAGWDGVDGMDDEAPEAGPSGDLARQMLAVEALKMQLGFIDAQICHLERRLLLAPCLEESLHSEIKSLRRTQFLVEGEREAAETAVQSALFEVADTTGQQVTQIGVRIRQGASQSLRGHSIGAAVALIRGALAQSGPWAHYAAFQFSTMLQREQELHQDFVCFYHSYSFASLLYEVHAEVARQIFDLPDSCPPLPRLSVPEGALTDLKSLQNIALLSQDHSAGFRALGLSTSCSIFASGSEAPPLSCFMSGYSCTDLSFHSLLVMFLKQYCQCAGKGSKSAKTIADELVEIAERHKLPTSAYGESGGAGKRKVRKSAALAATSELSGYMLQIFVRRDIVETFAYPSHAMGVPIPGGIADYTMVSGSKADGQARVLFHPPTFLDSSKVQMFHYCARPLQSCMSATVPESRGSLIKQLRRVLRPVLKRRGEICSSLQLGPAA
mmetsp:Transcript_69993/g.182244  ORF Transcript_69993/g.182244 Transcript_69993/m.182244 type:complete len:535 (+) Transcript_69993:436-2040(+)